LAPASLSIAQLGCGAAQCLPCTWGLAGGHWRNQPPIRLRKPGGACPKTWKIPLVRSLEIARFIAQASVLHWIHRDIAPDPICVRLGVGVGWYQCLWVFHLVGVGYGYLGFTSVWRGIRIDWAGRLSGTGIPAASRHCSGSFV